MACIKSLLADGEVVSLLPFLQVISNLCNDSERFAQFARQRVPVTK